MSFRIDGYIDDWLQYLSCGDQAFLDRSNAELGNGDSITVSGLYAFAEGLSLLAPVTDLDVMITRLQHLMSKSPGNAILGLVGSVPSYCSASDASAISQMVCQSEKTVAFWVYLLHAQSIRGYGIISTEKPFHALLQQLALGYLNEDAQHQSRQAVFKSLGIIDLASADFYRQVAKLADRFVSVATASFHDQVGTSKGGLQGLIDAGANLSAYMNNLTPRIGTARFKQHQHLKRALSIYAEILVSDASHTEWKPLTGIIRTANYPKSHAMETTLSNFFIRAAQSHGSSFEVLARMLGLYEKKRVLVGELWQSDDFVKKVAALPSRVALDLLDGCEMKNAFLRRYPEHSDASFSRDLGL